MGERSQIFLWCIGDGTVAHANAGGRTPAHDVSHPPVTLSISKRPHVEPESASEADGASEQDYESYVVYAVRFLHTTEKLKCLYPAVVRI